MITISQPLPPIPASSTLSGDDPPDTDPDLSVAGTGITPFPLHCLPSTAGDMAREIGRVTTAQNQPLAAAAVIGTLSASIGAGLTICTGGERWSRANVYLLGIADSGTGKGESHNLAVEPFDTVEAEAIDDFEMHMRPGIIAELKIAEARSKKICSDAAKEKDPHARYLLTQDFKNAEGHVAEIRKRLEAAPRFKVGDVTKEALAIVMAGQPGNAVASLSSEARGIFSIIKGRYGKEGGDEDFYCSAYSGDGVTFDRVGRARVILKRPCLAVLWMVQPDAAANALGDENFVQSGLMPRFLMFDSKAEPQERFEQPMPIPAKVKAAWANLIRSLATNYRMGGDLPEVVSASRDAMVVMTDYERENVRLRRRSGELRDIAPFVARWTENGWRLALVLHVATHGAKSHLSELSGETASNAVEIMRWFTSQQLEVLSAARREKSQNRLLALLSLLAAANNEISIRDLHRSNGFERGEIDQICKLFPDKIRIEKRKPETGRPSLWVVKIA